MIARAPPDWRLNRYRGMTMTQRDHRIEHEIERTLTAFDSSTRLKASPWFAHRVRTRVAAAQDSQAPLRWFALPRLRPALLALIVLLNLVTAVVAIQRSEHDAATRVTYIESFASEYAYTTNDMLFDLDEP